MKAYVNCITSGAELRSDIKVLIPEMNLRRRMSHVVKSGVAAGIESLLEFGARAGPARRDNHRDGTGVHRRQREIPRRADRRR